MHRTLRSRNPLDLHLQMSFGSVAPLDWISEVLADGPCQVEGLPQDTRKMLARMWSHLKPHCKASKEYHTYEFRSLRMVGKALEGYQTSLQARAAAAKKEAEDAAADAKEDGSGTGARLAQAISDAKRCRRTRKRVSRLQQHWKQPNKLLCETTRRP